LVSPENWTPTGALLSAVEGVTSSTAITLSTESDMINLNDQKVDLLSKESTFRENVGEFILEVYLVD